MPGHRELPPCSQLDDHAHLTLASVQASVHGHALTHVRSISRRLRHFGVPPPRCGATFPDSGDSASASAPVNVDADCGEDGHGAACCTTYDCSGATAAAAATGRRRRLRGQRWRRRRRAWRWRRRWGWWWRRRRAWRWRQRWRWIWHGRCFSRYHRFRRGGLRSRHADAAHRVATNGVGAYPRVAFKGEALPIGALELVRAAGRHAYNVEVGAGVHPLRAVRAATPRAAVAAAQRLASQLRPTLVARVGRHARNSPIARELVLATIAPRLALPRSGGARSVGWSLGLWRAIIA